MVNIKKSWCVIILAVVVFTAYSFCLSAPFKTLDDEASIVKNDDIKSFSNLGTIFTTSFFGGNAYYRPLVSLSFMTEYHFFGLNPFYYYLTNILIHILSTLIVFLLMEFWLGGTGAAFAVALLFGIHPVHAEAVTNIPGRAILLCGFFYLASVYCFLMAEKKGKIFYGLSLAAFVLALLSKESAGVLPLLLIVYLWLFKRKAKDSLIKLFFPLIAFFAIQVVYIILRKVLGITQLFHWRNVGEALLGFVSFLRTVITDIRVMILPVDLHFDRMQRVFTNPFEPEVLLTIAVFLAFAGIVVRNYKKIPPLILFFIAWFFIDLLPVSQVFASVGVQPGFISSAEHFLYLPSVGILGLAVVGVQALHRKWTKNKIVSQPIVSLAAVGIFIFFFLTTVQQNIYATTENGMFEHSLNLEPRNTRLRLSLALSYAQAERFAEAEENFRKVLEIEPTHVRARIGLGKALCDQGKCWEGAQEYEKIVEAGALEDIWKENLRLTYDIVIKEYQEWIAKDPGNARLYYTLGVIHTKKGNLKDAIDAYQKSLLLDAQSKNTLFNLASAYEASGEVNAAAMYYQRLLDLGGTPDELNYWAYVGMGRLAERRGDIEKSRAYFKSAEELKNTIGQVSMKP